MTSLETLELEAVDAALAGRYVAAEHAELADLALLLRDEKPEPAPAWATHLDRRVEAGFPARPKPRRAWISFRRIAPAGGLLVAVVALVVAAAVMEPGGDDAGEGAGSSGVAVEEAAPEMSDSGGGVATDGSGQRAGGDPASDGRRNRFQQRSATLTLAVPRAEIDSAANDIARVTGELGGFVASSDVSTTDGGSLHLRVPSTRLDDTIERLRQIGRMRHLSRRSVDITSNVVSARERLADARAERKALLAQLAAAVTVNETESIRERLDIVSREIAAARRQLSRVNNRANFADVYVTLVPRAAADEGAWTPGDAFRDALRVLEVVAGGALIAAAVALPIALLWLLIWIARRGLTRRGRERALDMA